MIKLYYLLYACVATCAVVHGMGDMGTGTWSVLSVSECEGIDDSKFECTIEVTRRKHNRTLDVLDVELECSKDIGDDVGAIITICKQVDGGCKEWQVVSDESISRFGKKYAESNMQRAFEMAKIDPPNFPIKAGKHSIKGFTMDYCEFPKECVYGTFTAVGNLLRDGDVVGCLQATVQFDDDTDSYQCD